MALSKIKYVGTNQCILEAMLALRFVANNGAPAQGGQQKFNAEHLLQIADELGREMSLIMERK